MRKIKNIFTWTIWSLLTLYVVLLVLVHLPFVQNWLGGIMADAIAKKLGTEVSVGRVDLGFLNRIIIDDVVIRDQQHQEMIRANRLSVKVELLPLIDGRFVVNSAQVFSMHAKLYKATADATPNYQFMLNSLASKEKEDEKPPLDLRVGSLIIRHSSVTYDQLDAPETAQRLNPQHLYLSDISAHVLLRTLTDDSLNVNVKRLTLREHSGLSIDRLAFKAEGNRQGGVLSEFCLQMPHSILSIDTLQTTYDLNRLTETLQYQTHISQTSITPSDLKALHPALADFTSPVTFDVAFSGTAQSLHCQQIDIRSDDLSLQASATLDQQQWQTQVSNLAVSKRVTEKLCENISNIPEMVTQLGKIRLRGQATRLVAEGDIHTNADISTDIGHIDMDISLTGDQHINAHVDTDSLNLRQLLNDETMGMLVASADIHGGSQAFNFTGHVPRFDWRGYHYQNIDVDGSYQKGDIAGKLKIDDPNIQTDVEGEFRRHQRTAVKLTGYIRNLAPQTLHLSDRWGDARISAIVDADFTASSLDDAEGTIDLDDFYLISADTLGYDYFLDNLHIKSGYNVAGQHFMNMNGDFGEMQLKGTFDWSTLPQSFIKYAASKMPTLPNLPPVTQKLQNNFDLSLRLTDANWIRQLIGLPLQLSGPLQLHATINDQDTQLDIKGHVPAFTYGESAYSHADFSLTTIGDSAVCRLDFARQMKNNRQMEVEVNAHAANNQLTSQLSVHDKDPNGDPFQAMRGNIYTITRVYTNDDGKPEAHIRILPSQLNLKGTTWQLEPSDILYSDHRMMVDHLTLRRDDQQLTIDGIASADYDDTLRLQLRNAPIAYLLELANFHAVRFGGEASGQINLVQPFDALEAWGDIAVPDFLFQQASMGALQAHARWNPAEKQIDLDAVIDNERLNTTLVNGFISPPRQELDLHFNAQGTPINFVHSFTKGFMSDIHGQCNGLLRLSGDLKHLELTGAVAVNGQASITPLGTTYDLRGDSVRFVPGDIRFQDFHAYDRANHMATINGGVHHIHFTQATFDLDINAQNLLAYDFPDMGTSNIGGTVYADATAHIQGRLGETVIDCDITPRPGSVFTYNVGSPDAVSRQQFITWNDKTDVLLLSGNGPQNPSQSGSTQASDLRINFRINATPDATLRLLMNPNTGDYITLAGNGALRASYHNKSPFQLFGTYEVERGTYSMTIQNIIKKNFAFQPGSSIVFGGEPFDAALSLKALYTVNGVSLSDLNIGNSFTNNTIRVNCLMNILGTASAPQVEFDLEMPTVNSEEEQMIRSIIASEQELNQQVVYLLGIGRFYTQGANNATTQQYGQTELAMQSLLSGTVSTQINEILSQVIKNDDWNFGANISTGNEGWHNAEYEGLVSGRMLNNRLLINGQFGYRDNATQATPSFIGDFDIRYLLYPNGNLAVKVYNQTNDRYFTHSSLNTQGVGLIVKKDFGRLGELFHSRKKTRTILTDDK